MHISLIQVIICYKKYNAEKDHIDFMKSSGIELIYLFDVTVQMGNISKTNYMYHRIKGST